MLEFCIKRKIYVTFIKTKIVITRRLGQSIFHLAWIMDCSHSVTASTYQQAMAQGRKKSTTTDKSLDCQNLSRQEENRILCTKY